MNEKEFNRAILAELVPIANEVFDTLHLEPGTYTAAELASGKGRNGYNIIVPFTDKIYTVSVGTFTCNFEASRVFAKICQLEKLAGVAGKDKARFTRAKGTDGLVCSFTATLGGGCSYLGKIAARDAQSMPVHHVYLDVANGRLCATDCRVAATKAIDITELSGKLPGRVAVIDAKDISKLSGVCHVEVYSDGYEHTTVITDGKGNTYSARCEREFPNFSKIEKPIHTGGHINVGRTGAKQVASLLKAAKRENERAFALNVSAGADVATFSCKGLSVSVRLESPATMDCNIAFLVSELLKLCPDWNGTAWINGTGEMAVLDGVQSTYMSVMPCTVEDMENEVEYTSDSVVQIVDRHGTAKGTPERAATANHAPATMPEPSGELMPELVPSLDPEPTANVPALYRVPDSIVAGFIESLCAALSVLRIAVFEIVLQSALRQLMQLARLSGVGVAELAGVESLPQSGTAPASCASPESSEPSRAMPGEPPGTNKAELLGMNPAELPGLPHAIYAQFHLNYQAVANMRFAAYPWAFRMAFRHVAGKHTSGRGKVPETARINAVATVSGRNAPRNAGGREAGRIVGCHRTRGPDGNGNEPARELPQLITFKNPTIMQNIGFWLWLIIILFFL